MAVNDFTGQNIQDTYQRVVQTDGTNLADGTGSLLPISFEGNDVIVPGALKAQSYIVSESIINVSSGSTIFGDSIDDSHSFNGAITASGNISASGVLIASKIFNSELTNGRIVFCGNTSGRLGDDADLTFANETLTVTKIANIDTTHVTASGNISASGDLTVNNIIGTVNGGTF